MNGFLYFWQLLIYKFVCLIIGKNYFMAMASGSQDSEHIETEDILLSDDDLPTNESFEPVPLNIDYNSRVLLHESSFEYHPSDDCDVRFKNYAKGKLERNYVNHTSSEELEISDEEAPSYETLTLQPINLDGIASVIPKLRGNSFASLNYCNVSFDKQYSTDAECVSEDEDTSEVEIISGKSRTLAAGLSVGVRSCAKRQDVYFPNKHSTHAGKVPNFQRLLEENGLNDHCEDSTSPLMTCLEFIKSEYSDEGETDVEDIASDEPPKQNGGLVHNINNSGLSIDFLSPGNARKSSITETLTEDETLWFENECPKTTKRRTKRHNRDLQFDNDCNSSGSLTDEEVINVPKQEWTETDESGGVRQITQIKTETSIKLEGDDDAAAVEGDDMISRTTATTTTRIVTTVTTDQDGETQGDQQVVEDGDDLRHSVEVILNQFMSDGNENEE